jgi:hypothetical protein
VDCEVSKLHTSNTDSHVTTLREYQGKVKIKVPLTDSKAQRGVKAKLSSLLTSAVEGGGWSAPRPGYFIPGKDTLPIVQKAGWAPGPVWTGAENLAHTAIPTELPGPLLIEVIGLKIKEHFEQI